MNFFRRSFELWLCVFGLCLALVQSANAQILTLQLPLSRASHTFSLWELNVDQNASGYDRPYATEELGIPGGFYQKNTLTTLNLIGGSFDGSGVWIPGNGGFLQGSIVRTPDTTTFFISDDTSGEIVHANTTALLNAIWVSNLGMDPSAYYSLPASRQGNQFLLNAFGTDPDTMQSWTGWWSLTTAPPIAWAGGLSAGFFEAWTPIPRGMESATIYNITAGEYIAVSGQSSDLSDPNIIWTPGQFDFWPLRSVFVATGDYTNVSYEVISPYGAPQSMSSFWNYELNVSGVSFSIGFGHDFWIRRLSDGQTSGTWNSGWGIGNGVFDASSSFSGTPTEDWQTISINASASRYPFDWRVRRLADGAETYLNWPSTNGTYFEDPTGTQSVWVDWLNGQAYVNVYGGWTIVNGSGEDIGQGPDFIDWPTFSSSSGTILIPRSRQGHSLAVIPGSTPLGPLGTSVTNNYSDVFGGAPYSVVLDHYSLSTTGEESITLQVYDQSTGEISPYFQFYTAQNLDLSNWHTTSNVALKISATRWPNTLQVRSANGSIFNVNKLKVQGDWSFNPSTGQSWFNSYGFFTAASQFQTNVPWRLYDVTKGQYLTADSGGGGMSFINATDNTDSDSDGLADWYEHMIGTNPSDSDTDDDGINDGVEVANGTNPRAGNAASDPNATLVVFTPLE